MATPSDPTTTQALVLVDIQNDFLPGGTLPVKDGDQVIPIANRLARLFHLVVATQDWHPTSHGSFAANHPGHHVGDVIDLHGLPQVLWPIHCVQGSRGAAFPPSLETGDFTRVLQKGTDPQIDSYSGFYDNGHRRATGLGEFLKEHGIQTLYVLGLATDYCVNFTALDAVAEGFEVFLIEDGCRGVELHPGDIDRALDEMRQRGVRIVNSANVTGD